MPPAWMLLNFAVAAVLALVAVGITTRYARSVRMLAQPGVRQSHETATPTGGGLGMCIVLALLPILPGLDEMYPASWVYGVLPGMGLLALIGWVDDRHPLNWLLRFLVQLGVSCWLLVWLQGTVPGEIAPGMLMAAVPAVLALVWTMNAYNFMDGSNGMAGAQGVFSGALLGCLFLYAGVPLMAAPAFAVAGVCLGFLPWNIPRARVFMGDAGSVPLGYALGSLMLLGVVSGALALPIALMVLSTFLTDASLTLFKRLIKGERWYTAHRKHVYQRLLVSGWTHTRVLVLYQAFNLFLVLPAVWLGVRNPNLAWALAIAVYTLLLIAWTIGSLKSGGETWATEN